MVQHWFNGASFDGYQVAFDPADAVWTGGDLIPIILGIEQLKFRSVVDSKGRLRFGQGPIADGSLLNRDHCETIEPVVSPGRR